MRIQVLREKKLDTAAFREAYRLVETAPSQPRAWTPIWKILESWQVRDSYYQGQIVRWVKAELDEKAASRPTLEAAKSSK
jgi:hypothetical protein